MYYIALMAKHRSWTGLRATRK